MSRCRITTVSDGLENTFHDLTWVVGMQTGDVGPEPQPMFDVAAKTAAFNMRTGFSGRELVRQRRVVRDEHLRFGQHDPFVCGPPHPRSPHILLSRPP